MCYWPQQITHSEISIILYIIRMSNQWLLCYSFRKTITLKTHVPLSVLMVPLHLPAPGQIIHLCIN